MSSENTKTDTSVSNSSSANNTKSITFGDLNLAEPLMKALDDVGYEVPTPIQAETIPPLLEGKDLLGQAQTGTGKTAAFALPLLSNIDVSNKNPQVMVLTPTRELAIQVAEAFQTYAKHIKGLHILPIYGGQSYDIQLRQLKRGVHVVVGTPGRVMDHMRRRSLKLGNLQCLVLDEADEMLRMGFIDDVEWVLEQIPSEHQIALFSATMPKQIRHIATRFMNKPVEITIKLKTATASTIHQRMWKVSGLHKLDALTRILESEPFDAVIIFVRTKNSTLELDDKLKARGYASAALNGDIAQNHREQIVKKLKQGRLDILIATDVAARGLDVERVSHVINYDIPYDAEAYIHRIGRTGRAGRKGEAILFVAPREMRMLNTIERATKQPIERMQLPSTHDINTLRVERFKDKISEALGVEENMDKYRDIVEQYQLEHNIPAIEIATALVKLAQGASPLFLKDEPRRKPQKERQERFDSRDRNDRSRKNSKGQERDNKGRDRGSDKGRDRDNSRKRPDQDQDELPKGMERFRMEVGRQHDVKPGNIVGAIANEAEIDSQHIGRVVINEDHSTVDLPEGMPKEVFRILKKAWVSGQQLRITKISPKRKGK
ncbi:MAG: DEAD/DEAH box helicase [Thiotrichaceae bacterium]